MGFLAIRHVDLSSLTRDLTHFPSGGRQILNHWTTNEAPLSLCVSVFLPPAPTPRQDPQPEH